MGKVKWRRCSGTPYKVGYTELCTNDFSWQKGNQGIIDLCSDTHIGPHGHVHLWLGDRGEARLPFSCQSQEGIKQMMELFNYLSPDSKETMSLLHRILTTMPEIKKLPVELTEAETQVLKSPNKRRLAIGCLVVHKSKYF